MYKLLPTWFSSTKSTAIFVCMRTSSRHQWNECMELIACSGFSFLDKKIYKYYRVPRVVVRHIPTRFPRALISFHFRFSFRPCPRTTTMRWMHNKTWHTQKLFLPFVNFFSLVHKMCCVVCAVVFLAHLHFVILTVHTLYRCFVASRKF